MLQDIAQSSNPAEAGVNLLQMFATAFRGYANANKLRRELAKIRAGIDNDLNVRKVKGVLLVYRYVEEATTEDGNLTLALGLFKIGAGDSPEIFASQYLRQGAINRGYGSGRALEQFLWVVNWDRYQEDRRRSRQHPSMGAAPPDLPQSVNFLLVPWEQLQRL